MSCGSKVGKSRSGNLISMIYSRDLAVVLLLSALLVLTFFMREAAVRHVLAQLEERSSVAVHHLAVEAENRRAAGLETGEQVWWGEVLERILLADDMMVGLRVLDDGGGSCHSEQGAGPAGNGQLCDRFETGPNGSSSYG